jgi:hypothetical protein
MQRDEDEFIRLLEECERLLSSSDRRTLARRVIAYFDKLMNRRKSKLDVQSQIKDVAPRVAGAIVSHNTAAKEVRRLLKLLKYRRLIKEWERTEYEVFKSEQSATNFEELKSTVKHSLDGARRVVQKAYVESLLERASKVENADSLVAFCKNSAQEVLRKSVLSFMTSVDDDSKYDTALECFRKYLNT